MAGIWRDFLNIWEECRSEAEEYREIDDERALTELGLSPETG
jgi:hypothetical protein